MKGLSFSLIALSILFSFTVYAGDPISCSRVRMDEGNGSMAGAPVLDQGELGLCYSYAATQMFDAWRRAHQVNQPYPSQTRSSPLYNSVVTTLAGNKLSICPKATHANAPNGLGNSKLSLSIEGGAICPAFQSFEKLGACPEEIVHKTLAPFHKGTKWAPSGDLQTVSALLDTQAIQQNCQSEEKCPQCAELSAKAPIDKELLDELDHSIEDISKSTLKDFKSKFDQNGCSQSGPVTPQPPLCVSTSKNIKQVIQEKLSTPNPLPIGISFCGGIIVPEQQQKKWREQAHVKLPTPGESWINHPLCHGHASLIIGRQYNKTAKRCDLVVRNQWGPNCDIGCKDKNCACEKKTGNLIVSEDYLIKNIMGVSTLP